jgi:hypothetical protein
VQNSAPGFRISRLGERGFSSPGPGMHFFDEYDHVLYDNDLRTIKRYLETSRTPPGFEKAGPGKMIYCDPVELKCGIVNVEGTQAI